MNSLVMIDDFRIPDDDAYGYDDYGQGKCISLEYLKPVIDKHQLFAYIPNYPALEESGERRGWVILVKNKNSNEYLSKNKHMCLLE
jgi:hypothetical protein